ncbi:hypothetical protein NDU88_003214 [Pleurodeles waltl]|uniref:Uncharacterized protein n=1 Tax=Pleurodeles waltl TaxID=8319 RepID=A0AAV7LHW9_PLEWA|nr:hypothetical protein NDU88_003214 [Pleurodeles waltl]
MKPCPRGTAARTDEQEETSEQDIRVTKTEIGREAERKRCVSDKPEIAGSAPHRTGDEAGNPAVIHLPSGTPSEGSSVALRRLDHASTHWCPALPGAGAPKHRGHGRTAIEGAYLFISPPSAPGKLRSLCLVKHVCGVVLGVVW